MSDNITIYEITKLMNDKAVIQNDLNEIVTIVKDFLYKKYITKFQLALDEQKSIVTNEPTKEIKLLAALKPFMEETSQPYIDQITDIMYKLSTAKKVENEIQKCSTADKTNNNSSVDKKTVHDDGIYELDNKCGVNTRPNTINITELIFVLLISGVIK